MDSRLYKAVRTSNTDSLRELARSDSTVLLQVTKQEDNILHVAAKYGQEKMTEEIIKLPRTGSLVTQKNSKGDTPLHIAARVGNLETVKLIINCTKTMISGEIEAGESERLLRMVNMEKNTALHDAVRNGNDEIAKLLIKEDPEITLFTNDVGESPLFVAVDKNYDRIAQSILQDAPVFSLAGRNNMNALHAAVVRSQKVLRLSSYLVKRQNPMSYIINMSFKHRLKLCFGAPIIMAAAYKNPIDKDVIECLTKKCESAISQTDDFGWTPLHYAVHLGAVDIVELLLGYIGPSTPYIRDKEGMSVIHIAARKGEVVLLKKLADMFPQFWDLQDNKGQTVLHLAVARRKLDSVRFILETDLSHVGLINQQDNEGNTALHLNAIQGNGQKILKLLIKDSRVDKTVTNMEGLTVIDIILLKEYGFVEKVWITFSVARNGGLESLEQAINKNGRKTGSTETTKLQQPQQSERRDPASDTQVEGQTQPAIRKTELEGLRKPSYDQLQKISTVNVFITTLIATVSFAAGFTMPGGYRSDGPEEGMAILSRKTAFRVSTIANALAFCFSTTSMFFHYCNSFVEKLDTFALYTYIISSLTSFAINAMVIAFISGTYAALADTPGLAKAVLSVGCSVFGLQLLVYLR